MFDRQHSVAFAELPSKYQIKTLAKEEEDAQEDEMRKYAALFKIKINQKNLDQLGDEIHKAYEKDVVQKGKTEDQVEQ